MSNTNPKDFVLKWEIPIQQARGLASGIPDNFLLIKRTIKEIPEHKSKWTSRLLNFHQKVLEKFFPPGTDEYRAGFMFHEKKLILVMDIPKDENHYILSKNGNHRAINNVALIDKIWSLWSLDNKKTKYYLKIHYWKEQEGMKLYLLTPQHFETRTPVFEDELKANPS